MARKLSDIDAEPLTSWFDLGDDEQYLLVKTPSRRMAEIEKEASNSIGEDGKLLNGKGDVWAFRQIVKDWKGLLWSPENDRPLNYQDDKDILLFLSSTYGAAMYALITHKVQNDNSFFLNTGVILRELGLLQSGLKNTAAQTKTLVESAGNGETEYPAIPAPSN